MTHVSGILAGRQARALTAALLFAGLSVSMLGGEAHAETKKPPKNEQVYCYIADNGNGEAEFYLPGQTIYNAYTKKYQTCGSDGNWIDRVDSSDPRRPQVLTGGGVYAP